jgi:hypothetical protein
VLALARGHLPLDCGLLLGGAGSLARLPGFIAHDAFPLALLSRSFTLVGEPLALVGQILAVVGDPVALLRQPVALIGDPLPAGDRTLLLEARSR